jgi:hypothetical protein
MVKPTEHHYASFLLRLWQTSDGDDQVWRASLENPGTRERHGFASLQELYEFIETQAKPQNQRDPTPTNHKD